MQKEIGWNKACQVCKSKKIRTVLPLGHHSVTQRYLDDETLHQDETMFPLNLCRCQTCGLLQLDYIVDPKMVFADDYPYRTGLTKMLLRDFADLAETVKKLYGLSSNDFVVDIGSNDGSLLKAFKAHGAKVLGVEPTGAARDANKNGIKTIQTFFDRKTAESIVKKFGHASIITSTNTFAHINHVDKLMSAVKTLLAKDGVFVTESQYLMSVMEKLEFDTIYHEHLRVYSLKPLAYLFKKYGMSLVDAERISAAGGSIRAFAINGAKPRTSRLEQLIEAEEKAGLYKNETYENFARDCTRAKFDFVSLLLDLKKQGQQIVGLTSSARSNSLLGTCKIDNTILDYLAEKDGSPKIGMYTPGTHILVKSEAELLKDQPPYLAILSWHIGDELIKKMRELGYKGKFIIPLPKAKIIE